MINIYFGIFMLNTSVYYHASTKLKILNTLQNHKNVINKIHPAKSSAIGFVIGGAVYRH